MRSIVLLLAYILCHFSTNAGPVPSADSFIALGYHAISGTNGAYLYNQTLSTRDNAIAACESDGASLFFPEDEYEFQTVIQHFQNKIDNFPNSLHLGMNGSDKGFFTIDGIPIENVYHKWIPGEPSWPNPDGHCVQAWKKANDWGLDDIDCSNSIPFVCKAPLFDVQCSSFGYTYFEPLGKCYKVHLTPKDWSKARIACQEEESDLAVINSQDEAAHLVKLVNNINFHVPGNFTRGVFHLGFHKNNVQDWQTIRGDSLYYSGYSCWGNKQPDGANDETCGSMFYNGHLNDINCLRKAFFICEHVIKDPNIISEPDVLGMTKECYNSV